MPAYVKCFLEDKIAKFLTTSATREACDEKAASLVGGSIHITRSDSVRLQLHRLRWSPLRVRRPIPPTVTVIET